MVEGRFFLTKQVVTHPDSLLKTLKTGCYESITDAIDSFWPNSAGHELQPSQPQPAQVVIRSDHRKLFRRPSQE